MDYTNSVDLLGESLLAPSTPSHNAQSENPTPIRYFLADNNDDDDEHDEQEEDEIVEEDRETQVQLVTLRILGKPFGKAFWFLEWPVAALMGATLGLGTLAFFAAVFECLRLWFPLENPQGQSSWMWLIVTALGGFACGILLLAPPAPNVGSVRTMFHDATDLKGYPGEALFVVIACFVCLATGAPLGPEMAIGAMGSGLASFVAKRLKVDRRTEAGWVFSAMAGSLGGLFPSPILGVTLAHELSVVGRPDGMTLDAFVVKESRAKDEIHPPVDHDFMEQVTLAGTAATSAYVVLHLLVPKSVQWSHIIEIGEEYHTWYLAAAIPLGIMCGLVASLALILLGVFRVIRVKTCEVLHEKFGAPKWIGRLFFPTLAGVLHGLLAVSNPFLVGSGIPFVAYLIQNQDSLRPGWLLSTALCKAVSMSLSLGFGLVGGPLFPMVFAGLCMGLACSSFLPVSLAVPCCMCATVGAFVPIPFTLVVYVALALSLTAEQMAPVFVATFVAYTFTGGLGVIRRLGERRLGHARPREDLMWFDDDVPPSDYSILRGIRHTIFGNSE